MTPETAYQSPQRQSILGVLLIFLSTLYKLIKVFWAMGAYLLLSNPSKTVLVYTAIGVLLVLLLSLGYSYLYYLKFIFYIDYEREEFMLEKGVFSTVSVAIPFEKIQQVNFKRSILQRVINVYSLVIDTAGSNQKEVEISAISKKKANELSQILLRVKTEAKEDPEVQKTISDEKTEHSWTYKLGFTDLLKIGVSTNYLRGLTLIMAFVMSVYNRLNSYFKEEIEDFEVYFSQFSDVLQSIGFLLLLFIGLLFLSVSITIIEVFLKYYGLKIKQSKERLELEMGLKTNTKVAIQPRRVQLVKVKTNPIQKRMNLFEAQISLSSSENELQKNKIKIPGLRLEILEKIKSFLYDKQETEFEARFRPDKLLLLRKIAMVFVLVLIAFGIWFWTDFIDLKAFLPLSLVFLVLALTYQFFAFRAKKLIIGRDFLKKQFGLWTRTEEILEIYKIQAVSVQQPLWYKRKNLINLSFHTAGGDIKFYAVSREILPYINFILFKAEVTAKNWM
jgi:putative membrane protein